MVNVLRRAGVEVDFPRGQTCCGQPTFNAGLRAEARQIAEHTIRVFESVKSEVVIPSGSCAHMIRHNYEELFADDPIWLPRAKALAARTYEFTEYLVDILGVTDFGARWDGPLTYHPTCHLHRGLGVDRQPARIIGEYKRRGDSRIARGPGLLWLRRNLFRRTSGTFGRDAEAQNQKSGSNPIPNIGRV